MKHPLAVDIDIYISINRDGNCNYDESRTKDYYKKFNNITGHNLIQNIQSNTRWMWLCSRVFIILLFFGLASCGDDISKNTRDSLADSVISSIDSMEQLNKIIETSKDRLLMFDFYADWCPPCKELESVLEKIAKEKSSTVTVYKINIDRNRGIANSFRVVGIPHVILFKNKKTVLALNGLYPKNMYLEIVERFSAAKEPVK